MKLNRNAFTLIELLVLVVIIGILTAIAVPMYENAIAKTRAIQLLSAIKSVASAQNRYFMEANEFASDPSMLDIAYPLNSAGTQFEFHFGTCNFTHVNDSQPHMECQMEKPHLTFHQFMKTNRLNCYSHSDDNYKADFVCQELTEEETPYKTADGMRHYSAGVKSE